MAADLVRRRVIANFFIQEKNPKEKISGSRSQVPPREAALEPCTKLGF